MTADQVRPTPGTVAAARYVDKAKAVIPTLTVKQGIDGVPDAVYVRIEVNAPDPTRALTEFVELYELARDMLRVLE